MSCCLGLLCLVHTVRGGRAAAKALFVVNSWGVLGAVPGGRVGDIL